MRESTTPFSRLGLGTAQFGFAYGVTNSRGKVAPEEARQIVETAGKAGMRTIDTASAYGESESVLGQLGGVMTGFEVITKTLPVKASVVGPEDVVAVRAAILRSRRLLRRARLDGLLIHHGEELLRPGGSRILAALNEAKARDEVARLGVSVYTPRELEGVLEMFTPELVQLPFNLLDQRFLATGLLAELKAGGTEIHTRSPFLQGALLAPPEALPPALREAPAFARVARFVRAHALTPVAACLGFCLSRPEIDRVILGVTGSDELADIIAEVHLLPQSLPDFSELAVADPAVVDASRWPLLSSE